MSQNRNLGFALLTLAFVFSWNAEAGRGRRALRTQQGIQSGEITGSEARRIRRGERRLMKKQVQARKDGDVTSKERAKIRAHKVRQNQRIHRSKNNDSH